MGPQCRPQRGVEAWKDVEYGVTPAGKMRFRGIAYFKDINEYQASPGDADAGPGGGGMKSEMRDGKWVLSMNMEPPAEDADPDAPKGEPVPADQIEANLLGARTGWQATKGMMTGFFADMKFAYRLKVAGEIDSVKNFEKYDTNVAGLVIDGPKIPGMMDGMMMDDELMKKSLAEGNVDEQGMPKPPPEVAAKLLFGEEGPVEIVINPGAPLFDYAAEVEAAKAAMSDDLKAMIEAGKAAAAADGPFGADGADF